ncbi:MAG: TadE/TadG family type IV pilus assembly protein [Arenicella sp.]
MKAVKRSNDRVSLKIPGLRCRGASIVEFVVIFPVFALLGLGGYQWTQLYEMKTALNHATFMAARSGSVNNADIGAIQGSLAEYLAPLYAPESASTADIVAVTGIVPSPVGKASTCISTPDTTPVFTTLYRSASINESNSTACHDVTEHSRIRILNPTQEAFQDFQQDIDGDGTAEEIPNVDLHLSSTALGSASGLNVQDANLLKIEALYSPRMKVPFVNYIFAYFMLKFTDPTSFEAQQLYQLRMPIRATSMVRMQTPAKLNDSMLSRSDAEGLVDDLTQVSSVQPGYEGNPWAGPTGTVTDNPFVDPPTCGS